MAYNGNWVENWGIVLYIIFSNFGMNRNPVIMFILYHIQNKENNLLPIKCCQCFMTSIAHVINKTKWLYVNKLSNSCGIVRHFGNTRKTDRNKKIKNSRSDSHRCGCWKHAWTENINKESLQARIFKNKISNTRLTKIMTNCESDSFHDRASNRDQFEMNRCCSHIVS